jgi:hypothetical protein
MGAIRWITRCATGAAIAAAFAGFFSLAWVVHGASIMTKTR